MIDSDSDDFEPQVRVSKLSRKKRDKNKEDKKAKPHTSTQNADLEAAAACTYQVSLSIYSNRFE